MLFSNLMYFVLENVKYGDRLLKITRDSTFFNNNATKNGKKILDNSQYIGVI